MVRVLSLLIVLGLTLGTCGWIVAQSGDGSGSVTKRPLDLPSGGRGEEEDEEDAPETITFYGSEYEGDGFFWCLDKSCSMGWNGEINTLKQEVTQAVNSLSTRAEFSLVSFSGNTVVWSPFPQKANPATKAAAIAWVQNISAGGWTCLAPAGVQTVNISNQSSKRRKQVLILSDGVPTCNGQNTQAECLANITAANWQGTPVNTLYISADDAGINFMQQLAQMNNGTFTLVE
ncbi:MAG: VWA domain-containing protein [Planctomycetota bacterium]